MPEGFSFSTTSTVALLKMNHSIKYVPITVRARNGNKSTVRIVNDGVNTMLLILNLTVLFNPLRVFIPVAVVFTLLGLGYFIVYCITVRIHITASMVMMLLTGVLLFFMGMLCEQISAVRREIRQN